MEFKRLADVEIVETANDTDKVLIEQNGEIKRVPKTEVGGSGGGLLIIDANMDVSTEEFTANANMTFDEAFAAYFNRELTGIQVFVTMSQEGQVMGTMLDIVACADYSMEAGFSCLAFSMGMSQLQCLWSADGFQKM